MPLVESANLESLLHIWPPVHRTAMHVIIGVRGAHLVSHVACPCLVTAHSCVGRCSHMERQLCDRT